MLRLTIIIPAHGRQQDLDDTLVSVLENRPTNCEVLVPHARSYHDPYDLSDEVRFVPADSAGLVELINAGIDASQASLVHILRSGVDVTADWTDAVLDQFAADVALAAVAPRFINRAGQAIPEIRGVKYRRGGVKQYVPVSTNRDAPSSAAIAWEGPSLQAAFYRRCALLSIGRLDAHLGEFLCDVDALVKLQRSGWRCGYEPNSRVVGELPKAPRGFLAGRRSERLFFRHAAALGPVRSLLGRPWAVGHRLVRQLPHPAVLTSLAGHLCGLVECLAFKRHRWNPEPPEPASSGRSERQSEPPSAATIPLGAARRRRETRSKDQRVGRPKRQLG